jgi:hypothetical protein
VLTKTKLVLSQSHNCMYCVRTPRIIITIHLSDDAFMMFVVIIIFLTIAGDTFAIKVLTKTELVRKNMVESVTNERNILAMVSLTKV